MHQRGRSGYYSAFLVPHSLVRGKHIMVVIIKRQAGSRQAAGHIGLCLCVCGLLDRCNVCSPLVWRQTDSGPCLGGAKAREGENDASSSSSSSTRAGAPNERHQACELFIHSRQRRASSALGTSEAASICAGGDPPPAHLGWPPAPAPGASGGAGASE